MEDFPDRAGTVVKSEMEISVNLVNNRKNKKIIEDHTDSKSCSNKGKEKTKIVVKYAEKMKNKLARRDSVDSYYSNNEKEGKLPPYPMDGLKRGVALVINNIKFENKKDSEPLNERTGADVDAENLKELFSQMRYEWIYWENQTTEQIWNKLKEFTHNSNELLKEVSSCFVIVMSHGGEGHVPEDTHIYASDNKKIKVHDIIERFSSSRCNLLQGKPKIIIFQACRGGLQDFGCSEQSTVNSNCQMVGVAESGCCRNHLYNLAVDAQPESSVNDQRNSVESDNAARTNAVIETNQRAPNMTDILIYYSTSPGFLSYRDPSKGTWFVQYFCEIFMNHVYNTDVRDLFDMISSKLLCLRTPNQALQNPHYAIRGQFKRCFLYPELITIDDDQDFLKIAKELEQKIENTKMEKSLKKLII